MAPVWLGCCLSLQLLFVGPLVIQHINALLTYDHQTLLDLRFLPMIQRNLSMVDMNHCCCCRLSFPRRHWCGLNPHNLGQLCQLSRASIATDQPAPAWIGLMNVGLLANKALILKDFVFYILYVGFSLHNWIVAKYLWVQRLHRTFTAELLLFRLPLGIWPGTRNSDRVY